MYGSPARHVWQPPQESKLRTTWSPGATAVTADPTLLDDACALVPEHGRERRREMPVAPCQVGMADPDGGDLDENLVREDVAELDVLEDKRGAWGLRDGCSDLHPSAFPRRGECPTYAACGSPTT